MEIEKRHQSEQGQPNGALFGIEKARRHEPGDPERKSRIRHGEQVVGPVRCRKDREPGPHDQHRQRRMLRVAPRQLTAEDELLGHVGVDVLAALGNDGVEGPGRDIAEEDRGSGALAPRGVAERIEKALDELEAPTAGIRQRHLCKHPLRGPIRPIAGRRHNFFAVLDGSRNAGLELTEARIAASLTSSGTRRQRKPAPGP
jgi:hypothetical protein